MNSFQPHFFGFNDQIIDVSLEIYVEFFFCIELFISDILVRNLIELVLFLTLVTVCCANLQFCRYLKMYVELIALIKTLFYHLRE